ncbi:MAG: hypothetical protein Q8936_23700 [Bacillota bacterium]|nr:hypothetical protein [Bacillota bacterium]
MTKLDWENITNYIDSVGTTDTIFPFVKVQSSVKVTASGARDNIIYTIGGQSGTLLPGQSVTVTGTISSMTLRSASGQQPFQVWAVEAGTEKDETDTSYQGQIDGLTTQLAQKAQQTDLNTTNANVALKADKTYVDTKVAGAVSGAPIAVSLVANMTDHTRNYVYTGTESGYTAGHWYFWNGSAWADGGTYQSTGIQDQSVTPKGTTFFNRNSNNIAALSDVQNNTINGITYYVKDGDIYLNGTSSAAFSIDLPLVNPITILSSETYFYSVYGNFDYDKCYIGVNNYYSNFIPASIGGSKVAFLSNLTITKFQLRIVSGVTFTNLKINLGLVKRNSASSPYPDYESYYDYQFNPNFITNLNDTLKNVGVIKEPSVANTKILNLQVTSGRKYYIELLSCDTLGTNSVSIFQYLKDGSYTTLASLYLSTNKSIIFNADSNVDFIKCYANASTNPTFFSIRYVDITDNPLIYNQLLNDKPRLGNVLFLGDSYTEQGLWINQLKSLSVIDNVVNLGVGSATLRDAYTDRVTYPYTSRPVQANITGNLNTVACQIEKLKRLMAGTDLDPGETQIYKTTDSYPNLIFIEAGTNDGYDIDTIVSTYADQIYTILNNVYTKTITGTASLGNAAIIKDINTINRTCFGGAIRYIYSSLHSLFKDALIIFITPCGLSYGTGGHAQNYVKKSEQIRTACQLLSIPTVDWDKNGRLNYLIGGNGITGSGTVGDPYIINNPGDYSLDSLHPNDSGALLLAKEVVGVLKRYFSH